MFLSIDRSFFNLTSYTGLRIKPIGSEILWAQIVLNILDPFVGQNKLALKNICPQKIELQKVWVQIVPNLLGLKSSSSQNESQNAFEDNH